MIPYPPRPLHCHFPNLVSAVKLRDSRASLVRVGWRFMEFPVARRRRRREDEKVEEEEFVRNDSQT